MKTALKHSICIFLIVALLSLCFVACDAKKPPTTYEIEKLENDFVLSYSPKDYATQKGLIFYVGEGETPASYDYIAKALAHRGYFVAIPKIEWNDTIIYYDNTSVANTVVNITNSLISNNSQISFVLAGHLSGGGSVVRYLDEHEGVALGAILLSPTYYDRIVYDNDGNYVLDQDGLVQYTFDTICDQQIATLVLDVAQPDEARLPSDRVLHILQNAATQGFGANSTDFEQDVQEQIEAQHALTIEYLLAFLQDIF